MARSFESMGAVRQEGFTVNGLKDPIRVEGQRATAEIFTLAGASMAAGRGLTSLSDTPGAPLEAVLSQTFSQEHFANDTSAVGRMIDVDGESCLIVGVLSRNSRLFMDADIVVSFGWLARLPEWQSRGNHFRTVAIGKLKQGVSAATAAGHRTSLLPAGVAIARRGIRRGEDRRLPRPVPAIDQGVCAAQSHACAGSQLGE